jgi:hypothetical protein
MAKSPLRPPDMQTEKQRRLDALHRAERLVAEAGK